MLYIIIMDMDGRWLTNIQETKMRYKFGGYTEIATGATVSSESSTKNCIKNIYDMAGNVWEWTTEVGNHNTEKKMLTESEANQAIKESKGVRRGGGVGSSGEEFPVSTRTGYWAGKTGFYDFGFRVVLYIR